MGAGVLPAVTVNAADAEPCGIVTVAGTLAAALELDSDMTAPGPAGPVRLTVPAPDPPLTMMFGLTAIPLNTTFADVDGGSGLIVRLAVTLVPE